MRLLELFSGTGSIGKAFRSRGHEVLSLDLDLKSGADVIADVLTWDYTDPSLGHFDAIWASPPCTQYSIARRSAKTPPNLELADSIVRRTLEIVSYFMLRGAKVWWMENPQSGLLKHREIVRGLPFRDTDYCQWGMKYRKRTRLWGNCSTFVSRHCDKATCHAVLRDCHVHSAQDRLRGCHVETAQKWQSSKDPMPTDRRYKTRELYVIPAELCLHICLATEAALVA